MNPFPPLYPEAVLFLRAIRGISSETVDVPVTGVTVPHHLLVTNLTAQGFGLIRKQSFQRVIILCPDHFWRCRTPFAVAVRDFQTALGLSLIDREVTTALLKNPLICSSNLFSHEHGIQAVLPYVAHFWPGAKVVTLAIRTGTRTASLDSLGDALKPFLGSGTLIVQSTDFSHYLPADEAGKADQETLRVMACRDSSMVWQLQQPRHLDCLGALYLQTRLQAEMFGAFPMVIANHNSQEYSDRPVKKTTSYLICLYSKENVVISTGKTFFFGGDTFFGRGVGKLLGKPGKPALLKKCLERFGCYGKLVVNLEGVLLDQSPSKNSLAGGLTARDGPHVPFADEKRPPGGQAQGVDPKRGSKCSMDGQNPLRGRALGVDPKSSMDGTLLEGVVPKGFEIPEIWKLQMNPSVALDMLRNLGVRAVSIANNHAGDYGAETRNVMRQRLEQSGIEVIGQGESKDFGPFRLVAFSDLDNSHYPTTELLTLDELRVGASLNADSVAGGPGRNPGKPLFVFMHWGHEKKPIPGKREQEMTAFLASYGADLVIGAHPHCPGGITGDSHTTLVYSLGNFLFDQWGKKAGGALLEVRFFPQGTFFPRLIPLGNLYMSLFK